MDEPVQEGSFASPRKATSRDVRRPSGSGSGFMSNAVATAHIANAARADHAMSDIETLCLDATADEEAEWPQKSALPAVKDR